MPKVHLPDGRVVHFPYDMPPEQIEAEVSKLVTPQQSTLGKVWEKATTPLTEQIAPVRRALEQARQGRVSGYAEAGLPSWLATAAEAPGEIAQDLTAPLTMAGGFVGRGVSAGGKALGALRRMLSATEKAPVKPAAAFIEGGSLTAPPRLVPPGTHQVPARTADSTVDLSKALSAAKTEMAAPASKSLPLRGGPLPAASAAESRARQVAQGTVAARTTQIAQALVKESDGLVTPQVAQTVARRGEAIEQAVAAGKYDEATTRTVQTVSELARDLRSALGAERAGERLFPQLPRGESAAAVRRMAPGPSRKPLLQEADALDRRFKFLSEHGGVDPKLLTTIGSSAVGGAIGASQGETPAESALYGGLGVVIGAGLATSNLPRWTVNAILANPASIAKTYIGPFVGAFTRTLELLTAAQLGKIPMATAVRESKIIIRNLQPDKYGPRFIAALKKGGNPTQSKTIASGSGVDEAGLIARIYRASDLPARKALTEAGMSWDDASRYTLAGRPTSGLGSEALSVLSKPTVPRFILRTITTMFPRVGIQIAERGLERMVTPAMARQLGVATEAGQRTGAALPILGAGAAGLGAATEEAIPLWLQPFAAAAAGSYALPFALGLAVRKGARKGKEPADKVGKAAQEALSTVAGAIPLSRYGTEEGLRQMLSGSQMVPNLVGAAARIVDPHERETGGQGFFGRTKAKVPGLRETLPIRAPRASITGERIERSSAIQRFLSGARPEPQPMKGVPKAVVAELERLEVSINPPTYERTLKIGQREVEVPPALADRARVERRQHLVPQIERLLASSKYQQLDDDRKRRALESTIRRANAAGSARARARLVQSLRQ